MKKFFILTLVLAFAIPLISPVAALMQFGSLLGYYAYLVKRYLLLMDHGARALILLLLILWAAFIRLLRQNEEKMLDNQG